MLDLVELVVDQRLLGGNAALDRIRDVHGTAVLGDDAQNVVELASELVQIN
ncbi:MAG: hypothetical protein HY725_14400 [Candidatus Rokubacteria bacterium]|nr:hypothetical protein [Candidatus Rokubacteria bacterium]